MQWLYVRLGCALPYVLERQEPHRPISISTEPIICDCTFEPYTFLLPSLGRMYIGLRSVRADKNIIMK